MSPIVRIKERREHAGMTQVQFAERVGVAQSTVAMWETADGYPRADKLPEIAKALSCTIDDLYALPPMEAAS